MVLQAAVVVSTALPIKFLSMAMFRVPSPSVAAFIGYLQLKPSLLAWFENAGASALHTTLPFGFNPGDATGSQGKGA